MACKTWKMKSITFCREPKVSSVLPAAGFARSKTIGLLARRHIVAGEFHFIGKEASTRGVSGVDLSMLAEAGDLDPADETSREYERVVDPKYLDQFRAQAKQFSNKLLSRRSGVARSAIMNFKKGRNTIKPRTLRKLIRAIHDLQNRTMKNWPGWPRAYALPLSGMVNERNGVLRQQSKE